MAKQPTIICLCGSTKFKDAFVEANKCETLAGRIVLSVGFFAHSGDGQPSEEQKQLLDELHLRKIDLADKVLFLNVDGYIGSSTERELAYSIFKHKTVHFLDRERGEAHMEQNSHRIGALIAEFMKSELVSEQQQPPL